MSNSILTRRAALTGAGAAALAGTAALAVSCVPTEAPANVHDPMLEAIRKYRADLARFDSISGQTDEEADLLRQAWGQLYGTASADLPPITTDAGAIEALRTANDEDAIIDECAENLLRVVLAYLEGRAWR